MCFSPEADFTAAAVVGVVGIETLRRVRTRRELIVGALPLLFAYAVLPVIVPIGLYLIEPSPRHRLWVLPFVALGMAVGGYLLWHVTQYPVSAQEHSSCIAYGTHTPLGTQAAVAYVIATCGPALLSSRRYLQWFGVANIVGVAIALSVREEAFASMWCIYAALVSVLILEHFRRQGRQPTSIAVVCRAEAR